MVQLLHTAKLRRNPAWLGFVVLMLCILSASAADFRDPFNTERYSSPAPSLRWQSPDPLPVVPEVPVARLPPGDRALTLPELTELALLNNPRTRQAWYAARAAAAGVGMAQGDDLPQINFSAILQRSETGGQSGNQVPWLTRY